MENLFNSEIPLTIKGSALNPVSIELIRFTLSPNASFRSLNCSLSPKIPKYGVKRIISQSLKVIMENPDLGIDII